MSTPKQVTTAEQKELSDLVMTKKEEVTLSSGRKVKVGWIMSDAQDKLDEIMVDYEVYKKSLNQDDPKAMLKGTRYTRRFYAKAVAALLLNGYFKIKLFWWLKWRIIYHFWDLNGDDYQAIVFTAKKKQTEQGYYLAMVLLMTMNDMWMSRTKKEAEAYRQELELASKRQS